MQLPEQQGVNNPNLLRILIEVGQRENSQRQELQTIPGRDHYFKIAATLLKDASGKPQPLEAAEWAYY